MSVLARGTGVEGRFCWAWGFGFIRRVTRETNRDVLEFRMT